MSTTTARDLETVTTELLRFSNIESMLKLLGLPQDKFNEVANIMGIFKIDWDNAPCDKEGPTKEQDADMDGLLSYVAEQLMAIR